MKEKREDEYQLKLKRNIAKREKIKKKMVCEG
jgi:hypothetical protein